MELLVVKPWRNLFCLYHPVSTLVLTTGTKPECLDALSEVMARTTKPITKELSTADSIIGCLTPELVGWLCELSTNLSVDSPVYEQYVESNPKPLARGKIAYSVSVPEQKGTKPVRLLVIGEGITTAKGKHPALATRKLNSMYSLDHLPTGMRINLFQYRSMAVAAAKEVSSAQDILGAITPEDFPVGFSQWISMGTFAKSMPSYSEWFYGRQA